MKKGERTKEHILKESRKLLITNGFHNTTVGDIIKATGVKKGNLYYHFSSKEELGLAVLEDAQQEFIGILDDSLVGETAYDRISNSLEKIFALMKDADLVGGCLFGNTALEMSDSNPRFSAIIRQVFDQWLDRLEELISKGQQEGSISNEATPLLLAKLIVASVEGAIMMARVNKSGQDLDDCLLILQQTLAK